MSGHKQNKKKLRTRRERNGKEDDDEEEHELGAESHRKKIDDVSSRDPYQFVCINCNGKFRSGRSYNVHFTPGRPACAYSLNEPISSLKDFTLPNLNTAALEHRPLYYQ